MKQGVTPIKPWLPVLLWASLIFFFSANPDPYRYLPAAWRSTVPLPTISDSSAAELLGQLMHFLEYTVLAFLVSRALFSSTPQHLPKDTYLKGASPEDSGRFFWSNTLITVLLSMLFALSDEIHQLFVPGRAFQLIDLLIDLLGVLFGVYLYQRLKIEPQRHEDSIPPG